MSKKILLIDDSITIHRVIDLSIDDAYEVQKAFSAEEANSKLSKFIPDVVLLDNKLDNTKINELIKEIKFKVPNTKVVLLVGAFDQFDEEDAKKLGADDFLVKPFNSTSLEEKLESMIPENKPTSVESVKDVVEQEPADEAVEELRATIEDTEVESDEEFIFDEINEELEFDKKDETLKESSEIKEAIDKDKREETLDDIFDDLELDEKPVKEPESAAAKTNILNEVLETEKIEEPVVEKDIVKKSELDLENLLDDDIKDDEDSGELVKDEISVKEEVVLEPISEENDIFADLESTDKEKKPVEDLNVFDKRDSDIQVEETVKDEASKIASEVLVGGAAGADVSGKGKAVDEVKPSDDSKSEKTEVVKINKEQIKAAVAEVLNEEFLKDTIKSALAENLEKVIWAIIPDLAEKLILQEIEKLKKGE